MFLVDVQLSLVVLAGVPVLMVFMFWIKKKQRRAWQNVSNKNSNLNAYLQENIVGARITQIFAREDENADIFLRYRYCVFNGMSYRYKILLQNIETLYP